MSRDTNYSALFNQLLEVDGPFLTVPIARRVFGKILDIAEQSKVDDLRVALSEWESDPQELNGRWIRWVLSDLLDLEDEVMLEGPPIAHLSHLVAQHGVTLRPSLVVDDPATDGITPRMLVLEWPHLTPLDVAHKGTDRWTTASPIARAEELCRALKVPLALVTSGDTWVLVHAPADGPASTAVWQSHVWLEERETLDFFVALCGAKSFFGRDEADTIEAIFIESADSEEEVTTTLGRQVKLAVELLVNAFSEADRARHGELLAETTREQVYRAAVTVMMRLVFLLSAEERGLLLLGDDTYDRHYAVSTLWDQLDDRAVEDDALFGRFDAWPRLLATFRLVHDGVTHDRLSLPAYGGQLFDPDRFPFLEGRHADEPFAVGEGDTRLTEAINNRVVKEILRSLQWLTLDKFKEIRRVSYRNLDVEQIGTVYEGLLDYTTVQVSEVTLGLLAKKSKKGNVEPELALTELEEQRDKGKAAFETYLTDELNFSKTELNKLGNEMTDVDYSRLRSACANDDELATRVAPFHAVLRTDLRGLPAVFLTDSYVVTKSSERATTGAHYTPRSVAEMIVKHTLEPLVYEPGPQNEPDPAVWKLRPWQEIVDLKIVDPACGSGAMLVGACRFLAARLVDAWREQNVEPEVGLPLPFADGAPLILPANEDDWLNEAMRVVADRCLYGVDLNEMAVEMCKLSLWLATLAKGKPFSFLDHAIRHGDSLLGVTSVEEIEYLRLGDVVGEQRLGWSETLRDRLDEALALRRDLLAMPTLSTADSEYKRQLFLAAEQKGQELVTIADALTGAYLSTAGGKAGDRDTRLTALAGKIGDEAGDLDDVAASAEFWLNEGRPDLTLERVPLHWPLAFPEVFLQGRGRFDGTVANPPFLGGQKISGALGDRYRDFCVEAIAGGRKGSADLVAYFFLRMHRLSTYLGYLATNTIGQGDTSEVGLEQIIDQGVTIHRAETYVRWPGTASVEAAAVWLAEEWSGPVLLDSDTIDVIDEMLYRRAPGGWRAQALEANSNGSFIGSYVLGMGFTMSPDEAQALIEADKRHAEVLFPYLGGEDLNQSPTHEAPRWVINFFDWPAEKAQEYPAAWDIIERDVKPFRQERKANGEYIRTQDRAKRYWMYGSRAPTLYAEIADLDRVLAICQTSKIQLPVFVPTGQVLSHKTVVLPYDDHFHFGLLSSQLHWHWVIRYGSTMRVDPVYTPSDVFVTFPQPPSDEGADEGLTDTYNRVHDADDKSADIARLRELHRDLDYAVRDAYGWDDLELEHEFHPVRGQGIRYTFSPNVAVEVLYRLLDLNRQRYEAEVADGLHGDTAKKSAAKAKKADHDAPSLF